MPISDNSFPLITSDASPIGPIPQGGYAYQPSGCPAVFCGATLGARSQTHHQPWERLHRSPARFHPSSFSAAYPRPPQRGFPTGFQPAVSPTSSRPLGGVGATPGQDPSTQAEDDAGIAYWKNPAGMKETIVPVRPAASGGWKTLRFMVFHIIPQYLLTSCLEYYGISQ